MIPLLLLLTPPPPLPQESEARRVIEAQLSAPPRETRLSPEEAEVIHRRYLDSIGQRLEREPARQ